MTVLRSWMLSVQLTVPAAPVLHFVLLSKLRVVKKTSSHCLQLTAEVFEEVNGHKPELKAIHAGKSC